MSFVKRISLGSRAASTSKYVEEAKRPAARGKLVGRRASRVGLPRTSRLGGFFARLCTCCVSHDAVAVSVGSSDDSVRSGRRVIHVQECRGAEEEEGLAVASTDRRSLRDSGEEKVEEEKEALAPLPPVPPNPFPGRRGSRRVLPPLPSEPSVSRCSRELGEEKVEEVAKTPAEIVAAEVSFTDPAPTEPSSWKDLRLLYIEDTAMYVRMLRRMAGTRGACIGRSPIYEGEKDLFQDSNIVYVRSGDLALELLKRKGHCFHAVISDEMIMGSGLKSGLAVAREYKAWERRRLVETEAEGTRSFSLPFVYFSANDPKSLDPGHTEVMESSVHKQGLLSFRAVLDAVGKLMQDRYPSFKRLPTETE